LFVHQVPAEYYEAVTVYFSDIVGFTEIAAENTPLEVRPWPFLFRNDRSISKRVTKLCEGAIVDTPARYRSDEIARIPRVFLRDARLIESNVWQLSSYISFSSRRFHYISSLSSFV